MNFVLRALLCMPCNYDRKILIREEKEHPIGWIIENIFMHGYKFLNSPKEKELPDYKIKKSIKERYNYNIKVLKHACQSLNQLKKFHTYLDIFDEVIYVLFEEDTDGSLLISLATLGEKPPSDLTKYIKVLLRVNESFCFFKIETLDKETT